MIKIVNDTKLNHKNYQNKEEPEEFKEVVDKLEIEKRIEDYAKDLADDGKRNYSNNPEKKSPGRKKKKSKNIIRKILKK